MNKQKAPLGVSYCEQLNKWTFNCSVDSCYVYVGLFTEQQAKEVEKDHNCPNLCGETKVSWQVYGVSLLCVLWTEMDTATICLMETPKEQQSEYQKGYARAIAYSLSLFMMPHFKSPDEIVREAVKRYKLKQSGEEYETPGLGSRRYEAPPGDNKYYKSKTAPTAPSGSKLTDENELHVVSSSTTSKSTRMKKSTALPDDVKTAIKNAAGMFSPEDLAGIYKTSVDEINKVIAGN